jgi:ABC-2 type transport system ATP-binding protein
MDVLEVNALVKGYGGIKAVNQLSFRVEKGSVFGLLGPNGSGKTTTLGCIMGVLKADGGSFSWFGANEPDEARKEIGALIETPNFYPYLSAEKNLGLVAYLKGKGKENISNVLKQVGLYDRRNSAFKTFSLGMKQRLAIASALLSDPEVLVLDEPTNGLDPQGINEIRQLILEQNQRGKTIILASHLLNEVEKVCTDLVILKKGNLIGSGTVANLLGKSKVVELNSKDSQKLTETLKRIPEVISVKADSTKIYVELKEGYGPEALNAELMRQNIALSHLALVKADLESEFLKLIESK